MVDSVIQIGEPFNLFHDIDGNPLEDGYIYIGQPGLDPIGNQITVYSDFDLLVPIVQPIRTMGGYPTVAGTMAKIYAPVGYYSITVLNKRGTLIYTDLTVEFPNNLSGLNFASLAEAAGSNLTGLNSISTISFYENWDTSRGPVGGALYYRDTTIGTPSTLYSDNSGFYDSNGDGFSIGYEDELNVHQFGAIEGGIIDSMKAFIDCSNVCAQVGLKMVIPAGQWLLNTDVGSIPFNNVAIEGSGVAVLTQPYEDFGTILLFTGNINPAFATQNNAQISNLSILYPDQKNPATSGDIIVYPATFSQDNPNAGNVMLRFENLFVYNAYDLWDLGQGSIFGPAGYVIINNVAGYAIRHMFRCAFAPTPIHITNCDIGYGAYTAYDVNNVLRDFSTGQGACFYVHGDGTAGVYPSTAVEGVFITNSAMGGYRAFVQIEGGIMGSWVVSNSAIDQIGSLIYMPTAGFISVCSFDNCWGAALRPDFPNEAHPWIEINGASPPPGLVSSLTITNCRTLFTRGGILKSISTKMGGIEFRDNNFNSAGNVGAGFQRLVELDEVNSLFVWQNNVSKGQQTVTAYGVLLVNCASGSRIDGSVFDTFSFAIGINTNTVVYINGTVTKNSASTALSGTGTGTIVENNTFDIDPTLPIFAGSHRLLSGARAFYALGKTVFLMQQLANAVNYPSSLPGLTGEPATVEAVGTDANIDLKLRAKGTGALRFGTYTATPGTITGYITIKDDGGTSRRIAVTT